MPDTDQILRDLLARVDALEARNDRLDVENRSLRDKLAAVQADIAPVPIASSSATPLERLSRRWLLRRGMHVAAASVAAGVLAQQTTSTASADSFEYVFTRRLDAVNENSAAHAIGAVQNSGSRAAIFVEHRGTGPAVLGESASANSAIEGKSTNPNGNGVQGNGRTGVVGVSSHGSGSGVYGTNTNNVGVTGEGRIGVIGNTSVSNYTAVVGEHKGTVGFGVLGQATGAGYGVTGRSPAGEGVRGEGPIGVSGVGVGAESWGVKGEGDVGVVGYSSRPGYEGVYGGFVGSNGYGTVGDGAGTGSGILGRNATGDAIRGEGKTGIRATSTGSTGYGAVVAGGKAQLHIVPKTTAGKPTSGTHAKGELLLDKNATLWICTVAGTPGTWRKVSTTAT